MTQPPLRSVYVLVLAGVAVALALLVPWQDDSLVRLQAAGSIVIGYAVEPPFAFVGPDGEVTGEAPELARRIAADLRIPRVEWRQMEFGDLIGQLEAGRIDVIAAGMFITPQRAERVAFSDPTMHVRPGLLVAHGNPRRVESYRQAAARSDLAIAVLAGAVEGEIMRRMGVRGTRLVTVPDALTGRRAVESGLADVLMLSEPTVRWMAHREELGRTDALVEAPAPGAGDTYGEPAFAFRRDERALRTAWNSALRAHLGSDRHRRLLARFGLEASLAGEAADRAGKQR